MAYKDEKKDTVSMPYEGKMLNIRYPSESDSVFIFIYSFDRRGKRQLIGQCEVLQRSYIPNPINVKIIYFQTNKESITSISHDIMEEVLNNHSHNQFFIQYKLQYNITNIVIDTTFAQSVNAELEKHKTDTTKRKHNIVFHMIRDLAVSKGVLSKDDLEKENEKKNTFYLVLTDYKNTNDNGNYITGTAYKAFVVLYSVNIRDIKKIAKTLAHEFGHSVDLRDTFNDDNLCRPMKQTCTFNYMDYVKNQSERNMFFKAQIMKVVNGLYAQKMKQKNGTNNP